MMIWVAMAAVKMEIDGNFCNVFWRWSQSISEWLDVKWEDTRVINYGSSMFGLSNERNIAFIF